MKAASAVESADIGRLATSWASRKVGPLYRPSRASCHRGVNLLNLLIYLLRLLIYLLRLLVHLLNLLIT